MILKRTRKTKRLGSDRRWTLLFIGDHGNVIALKRFKAIVTAAGLIFLGAIGTVTALFWVNYATLSKNRELQSAFEKSKSQIEDLRHEKEILMARLVIAESKAKDISAGGGAQSRPEVSPVKQTPPKPQVVVNESPDKAEHKSPAAPEAVQPKPVAAETAESEADVSVAAENFSVAYETDSENLNAQFKIKNTSPQSQSVSGHVVLVLKGDDLPAQQWLVMPAVAMAGDVPSGKQGKMFSIRRFRTMNFAFKAPDNFEEFETAAVYVFSKSGELLLEEDFPVTLPPPPAAASRTPVSEMPSSEPPPAAASRTPVSETPSSEPPPADTPSSETHWP
jgi:hypothetical protein